MTQHKKKVFTKPVFTIYSFLLILALGSQTILFPFNNNPVSGKKLPADSANSKEKMETGPSETSIIPAPDFGLLKGLKTTGTTNIIPQAASLVKENEPNNTPATATPIGRNVKVKASTIFPNGDIDFYSFQANAGDRVYAATMTAFSAGNSTDSQLTLLASDGTTVIETDNDNGSSAALSSSIAGAVIPTTGTYYIKANDFTAGTTSERPYDLWVNVQSGAPTPETEPNDNSASANPLPANGWVSGSRDPAAEQDWYSMTLNAGDTVFLSLDLDPERDLVTWNGRVGFALFGDAGDQILLNDDAGSVETPGPTIPSESLFATVKNSGTYYAYVDSASAAVGGPTATYNLSVSVLPKAPVGINCTTYTSTDVPKTIGPGTGLVSSTITVPGNPRIASMRVAINANHALMNDIDAQLRSPAGNDNGIFTDIGAAAVGGQTMMDVVFDEDAGTPPVSPILKGFGLKPELNYRLSWFNGEDAGGTWTLDLRDDTAGANGGTLNSWSMEICEQPATTGSVVYSESFNANDGGYTHSGTADEWEYGVPNTVATTTANPVAAIQNCNNNSAGCWKTDLDNTYNINSNQDLFSPNVNLTAVTGTIQLKWAAKYQMESANFDHFYVEVQDVNNSANNRIVWQWLDATMTNNVGNPAVNIGASAGWGNYVADISDFSGKLVRLRFHLDTDNTVNFSGPAIDDVLIMGIAPTAANVGITGRVSDPAGRAIPLTTVILTGSNGVSRAVRTNTFGYYHFDNIEAGESYVLNARAKGHTFAPQILTVQDEIVDANIVAIE